MTSSTIFSVLIGMGFTSVKNWMHAGFNLKNAIDEIIGVTGNLKEE